MKQKLINDVVQGMLPFLNNAQAERLQDVLQHALWRYEVCETTGGEPEQEQDLVALFLSAKRIEGCSEKSLKYYQSTIQAMLDELGKRSKRNCNGGHSRVSDELSMEEAVEPSDDRQYPPYPLLFLLLVGR